MLLLLKKFIAFLLSVVLSSSAAANVTAGSEPFRAKDPDNVRLSVSVLSDVHVQGQYFRRDELAAALYDMQQAPTRQDAVVLCGDNTNSGARKEYEELKDVFGKYDAADNKVLAIGNHDTWSKNENGDKDAALVKELFTQYTKEIGGREIDNVYYSLTVKGVHLIVLGSEGTSREAAFSDAQLDWLAREMAAAAGDGKPIFVFCHWPINGTHGLPYTWEQKPSDDPEMGGIGPESDRVKEILSQYRNVFFVSGHIHGGFSTDLSEELTQYCTTEELDGIHCINMPIFSTPNIRGHIVPGTGIVFETYDDHVLLRARNFLTGTWLPQYDVTYPLY